jgi:C-terminal processing protease CtpA/Prc
MALAPSTPVRLNAVPVKHSQRSNVKRLSLVFCALLLFSLLAPATALAKGRLGFAIAVATDGYFSTTLAEVKVTSVQAGSPSEKAGLKAGDLLVEMNGTAIKGASGPAMKKILGSVKAGEHLLLKVQRASSGVLDIDIVAGP